MLFECGVCNRSVDANELGSYERFYPEIGDPPILVTFLSCPACQAPNVVEQEWIANNNGIPVWDEPRRRFPPVDRGLGRAAPSAARTSFTEAQQCFRAKCYTAATLMAVRTLETICDDQGIKRKTLNEGLKQLHSRGEIDDRLYEWANALRDVRNEAAHQVGATISGRDAEDVLGFTEAIVDYMYVYRKRFDAFMKHRNQPSI